MRKGWKKWWCESGLALWRGVHGEKRRKIRRKIRKIRIDQERNLGHID